MKHFKNTLKKVIVISFLKESNLLPLNTGDMCERHEVTSHVTITTFTYCMRFAFFRCVGVRLS